VFKIIINNNWQKILGTDSLRSHNSSRPSTLVSAVSPEATKEATKKEAKTSCNLSPSSKPVGRSRCMSNQQSTTSHAVLSHVVHHVDYAYCPSVFIINMTHDMRQSARLLGASKGVSWSTGRQVASFIAQRRNPSLGKKPKKRMKNCCYRAPSSQCRLALFTNTYPAESSLPFAPEQYNE
jgi:hypothetical protein